MPDFCKGCFFENNGWDECFPKQNDTNRKDCEDFVLPDDITILGGPEDE